MQSNQIVYQHFCVIRKASGIPIAQNAPMWKVRNSLGFTLARNYAARGNKSKMFLLRIIEKLCCVEV